MRGTSSIRPISIAFSCALLASGAARAADPVLPSSWRRADITIDGVSDEWSGKLVPIEAAPLSIGVRNDGRFLYVCVRTSDEAAKEQILARGLSLYLDATAKERRGFGVRFPAGRANSEHLEPPDTGDPASTKALRRAAAGTELVFLGSEADETFRVPVSAAKPVEAALGEENGALVVELKVPLAYTVDSPHAVETQPGKRISLGVETTEPKGRASRSGEGREGAGRGNPGGGGFGFGGGGGGQGGRGGGGMRGGRMRPAEGAASTALGKPLKAWLVVELATEPAP